jgi:hypothetical protein
MRGETVADNGVTGVTGVTGARGYASKSLELCQLRRLRLKDSDLEKSVFGGVVEGVTDAPEPDEVEIQERTGLAAGGVPPIYVDAWARLQCRRPPPVCQDRWRTVINDAGLFLDAWGEQAVKHGWTVGEIFDVPRGGARGGLIWFIEGEGIEAFGAQYARTHGGRCFDRAMTKGGA